MLQKAAEMCVSFRFQNNISILKEMHWRSMNTVRSVEIAEVSNFSYQDYLISTS